MCWGRWVQIFSTEKNTEKRELLLMQSHTSHSDRKIKDFRIRELIYV